MTKTKKIELAKLKKEPGGSYTVTPIIGTDQEAVQALLLWARKERIDLSFVTVGTVTVQVTADRKAIAERIDRAGPEAVQARANIYDQFGGELMKETTATPAGTVETNEPTVEDDD